MMVDISVGIDHAHLEILDLEQALKPKQSHPTPTTNLARPLQNVVQYATQNPLSNLQKIPKSFESMNIPSWPGR